MTRSGLAPLQRIHRIHAHRPRRRNPARHDRYDSKHRGRKCVGQWIDRRNLEQPALRICDSAYNDASGHRDRTLDRRPLARALTAVGRREETAAPLRGRGSER
jgi:hypothetical protein